MYKIYRGRLCVANMCSMFGWVMFLKNSNDKPSETVFIHKNKYNVVAHDMRKIVYKYIFNTRNKRHWKYIF